MPSQVQVRENYATGGLIPRKRTWPVSYLPLTIVASSLLVGAWTRWFPLEQLSTGWLGLVALLMVGVSWGCVAVSVHRGATLQELLKLIGLLGMFLFALTSAGSEHRLHSLSWVVFGASVAAMAAGIVLHVLSPRVATGPIASLAHGLVVYDAGGRLSAFFSYPNALAGKLIRKPAGAVKGYVTDTETRGSVSFAVGKDDRFRTTIRLGTGLNTLHSCGRYLLLIRHALPNFTVTVGLVSRAIISLQVGSPCMTVDGSSKTMSTAPTIIGGRTMIPLRFVAENLGCLIGWDQPFKGVTVVYGG